jgi:hypothetical protein
MKTLTLLVLCCVCSILSSAQTAARNTFYLEAGGASIFYSLNYDRLLGKQESHKFAVRGGVMYLFLPGSPNRQMYGVPVGFSWLKKQSRNYFELGISCAGIGDYYGSSVVNSMNRDFVLIPSVRGGIRHQPASGGWFWNALLQFSVIAVNDMEEEASPEISYLPMASVGVGYSF